MELLIDYKVWTKNDYLTIEIKRMSQHFAGVTSVVMNEMLANTFDVTERAERTRVM